MLGSVPMRWPVLFVCNALALLGCVTNIQGVSGSLSLDLVINGDTGIDAVRWSITREGTEIKSGTINTSAPGATATVEAYGLLPGDGYTITMEAMSADGETTCEGSTMFSITVGQVTEMHIMMSCKRPRQFGGVRANGRFNICPQLRWADASPLQTSVGNDIDFFAMATDEEGDPITHMWSSGSGIIASPMMASTTYTCTEVGADTITVLVTDDGGTYCMDMYDFDVTCVAGDGNPCDGVICEDTGNECTVAACNPGTGGCETSNVDDGTDCDNAAGMCMGGTCVDKDRCMDVVCTDEGNECTVAICNPDTGLCEGSNVADGTSCGDGGACMGGTCIVTDPCEGVVCDDTGNECTIGVCNSQTEMCDVMNVENGTACLDNTGSCLMGVCEVSDLCDNVPCLSENDCIDGGTCNPTNGLCEGGGNQPMNTPCVDGICDGQGMCVECNNATQCPDDSNECTVAACAANQCGQANVMNGMVCDLLGIDDGMCEGGICVAVPECTADIQCDDGDECTVNTCPAGMCVTQAEEDGVDCDAGGTPGSCQSGVCRALCDGVNCGSGNDCIDGGTCNPNNGLCEGGGNEPINEPCAGGVCDGQGMCVQCNNATQCPDDSNQCTVAACAGNQCGQANAMNGMVCDLVGIDDGMCEGGTCVAVPDCTADIQCDDSDECTVNTCPAGTCITEPQADGVDCDTGGAPGRCESGICVSLCASVNCSSGNDCVDGGACNPSNGLCEGGGNQPMNTPCVDGVCDGQGMCVECNNGTQCPGDSNQCTVAACIGNQCGQANVMNGLVCDLFGIDDGMCESGICVAVPECTADIQCDDGDECTLNICPAGTCITQPEADGVDCDAGGTPGSCESGVCQALCAGVNCGSGNDCVDGGTCNPNNGLCEGGGNQPMNTPCTDGVCDGQGMCVQCNNGTQCPDDSNQCTVAACAGNQCGQANVMNGMVCDLVGIDDGMCEGGTCVGDTLMIEAGPAQSVFSVDCLLEPIPDLFQAVTVTATLNTDSDGANGMETQVDIVAQGPLVTTGVGLGAIISSVTVSTTVARAIPGTIVNSVPGLPAPISALQTGPDALEASTSIKTTALTPSASPVDLAVTGFLLVVDLGALGTVLVDETTEGCNPPSGSGILGTPVSYTAN